MIQSHIDKGRSSSERIKLGLLNPQSRDFKWKSTHLEAQIQAIGSNRSGEMFACFMNGRIAVYEASVVPLLHSISEYPTWLENYQCCQVQWINEHWIYALFISSMDYNALLCQISFSRSDGTAFFKKFSLNLKKNGPKSLIPLDTLCGSVCVLGTRNEADTTADTLEVYVASSAGSNDILKNPAITASECSKLEPLVEIRLDGSQSILHISPSVMIASDGNAMATIAFATVSTKPNTPSQLFLHKCNLQYGFELIPKLSLCSHFYQAVTGTLSACTGINLSSCGKKLVLLSRGHNAQSETLSSQSLLTQISVFTWNECSNAFIFNDSLNIRSPLFHISINYETDKSDVSLVTHSTIDGGQLSLLKWSPDTNNINEEDLGSPPTGDLLTNTQNIVDVFFFQKENSRNQYYSSVFLIFAFQYNIGASHHYPRPPIKSKNSFVQSSPSSQSISTKLCWCYKRNSSFDFAGAMYPVGYQLVMESYLYREKEDEFDRVDSSLLVHNSVVSQSHSVESFPVMLPNTSIRPFSFCENVDGIRRKIAAFCEMGKNENFDDAFASNGVKSSVSKNADILPILSTCRISIVDGVLQIKPPSASRIALEDWLTISKSKPTEKSSFSFDLDTHDFDSRKKGLILDAKSQRYVNVSRAIESVYRDDQVLLQRKVEFLRGAVERTAKTEYFSFLRKLRGKERATARQQEKQALLLSLLKENEEEKRKLHLQEQEQQKLKQEVAGVLENLLSVVEQSTAPNIAPIEESQQEAIEESQQEAIEESQQEAIEESQHPHENNLHSSLSIDNPLNCV